MITYDQARQVCLNKGGDLPTPRTPALLEELKRYTKTFSRLVFIYIGFRNDKYGTRSFRWRWAGDTYDAGAAPFRFAPNPASGNNRFRCVSMYRDLFTSHTCLNNREQRRIDIICDIGGEYLDLLAQH